MDQGGESKTVDGVEFQFCGKRVGPSFENRDVKQGWS